MVGNIPECLGENILPNIADTVEVTKIIKPILNFKNVGDKRRKK
jgi:hypothetical protein